MFFLIRSAIFTSLSFHAAPFFVFFSLFCRFFVFFVFFYADTAAAADIRQPLRFDFLSPRHAITFAIDIAAFAAIYFATLRH